MTCKEATYFTHLAEEGKLSLWLRLRLFMHLRMCPPCLRFKVQTKQLVARLRGYRSNLEQQAPYKLSPELGEEIRDEIRNYEASK